MAPTMTGEPRLASEAGQRYLRAANFLAAAQIYLQDNVLLERPLRPDDVKPRLLGHWGTCPGINLVQAALNGLILRRPDADLLLVVGPGHGAAAPLANLYLDGSLAEFAPAYSRDRAGLERFVRAFSWPGGFASHLNPAVPGTIYEGGELGYALATAFGAVLDNPSLVAVCIVGDGEAETGATAAAWHSPKFVDPVGNGLVLPILHLNGFKISNPTVFAAMDDADLRALFTGYGWSPAIVDEPGTGPPGARLEEAVDAAYERIRVLQRQARQDGRAGKVRWPMIVLRSPKGWTGPAEVDDVPVVGTIRAHQVPAGLARTNPVHLAALEAWLRSYRPQELFDPTGAPAPDLVAACPVGERRLGMNRHTRGWEVCRPLERPPLGDSGRAIDGRGTPVASALVQAGDWLAELFRRNEATENLRLVCPDETASNQLGSVFRATGRAFAWPVAAQVARDSAIAADGRVMEILSEHTCLGWLEGYLQTGRHGIFPCYEAFVMVVESMVSQYAKWLKLSNETPWRRPVPSLNILLTSDAWRQDHNGYSHQGPGFINSLLTKKSAIARIYFPPDGNALVSALDHCLTSVGYINLIVATKQPLPQWLSMEEAVDQLDAGAAIWEWASCGDPDRPDVVFAAAGNVLTVEALAAVEVLHAEVPDLSIRFVSVADLMALETDDRHAHGLSLARFTALFTADRPVVFNFHGYPSAIHQLIYKRPHPERFHVHGYEEEGTTTTPFDMLLRNRASRWDLVIAALERLSDRVDGAGAIVARYREKMAAHRRYVETHGADPASITGWRWRGLDSA